MNLLKLVLCLGLIVALAHGKPIEDEPTEVENDQEEAVQAIKTKVKEYMRNLVKQLSSIN